MATDLQTEMLTVLREVQAELTDMSEAADGEDEHWDKGGSAYELLEQVNAVLRKAHSVVIASWKD